MDAVFERATVTLPRDAWAHVRDAAGRLPLRRSRAPVALEAAWRALDRRLRATPPATRVVPVELTLGEHAALSDAATQGALPRLRPAETADLRAYAREVARLREPAERGEDRAHA